MRLCLLWGSGPFRELRVTLEGPWLPCPSPRLLGLPPLCRLLSIKPQQLRPRAMLAVCTLCLNSGSRRMVWSPRLAVIPWKFLFVDLRHGPVPPRDREGRIQDREACSPASCEPSSQRLSLEGARVFSIKGNLLIGHLVPGLWAGRDAEINALSATAWWLIGDVCHGLGEGTAVVHHRFTCLAKSFRPGQPGLLSPREYFQLPELA